MAAQVGWPEPVPPGAPLRPASFCTRASTLAAAGLIGQYASQFLAVMDTTRNTTLDVCTVLQ
jgi:hypothetical protein